MTLRAALGCALALACGACSTPAGGLDGGVDEGVDAGPPEVVLGTGENEFDPLTNGQDVPLVMGCQGGYHVWTSVRTRGLNPSVPILDLTLTRVRDGATVSMLFHVRSTLTPNGDWNEGYGYRLQATTLADVLGEDVDVRVTVTDRAGLSAADMRRVHVVDGGSACSADASFDGPAPRDPDAGAPDAADDAATFDGGTPGDAGVAD